MYVFSTSSTSSPWTLPFSWVDKTLEGIVPVVDERIQSRYNVNTGYNILNLSVPISLGLRLSSCYRMPFPSSLHFCQLWFVGTECIKFPVQTPNPCRLRSLPFNNPTFGRTSTEGDLTNYPSNTPHRSKYYLP